MVLENPIDFDIENFLYAPPIILWYCKSHSCSLYSSHFNFVLQKTIAQTLLKRYTTPVLGNQF